MSHKEFKEGFRILRRLGYLTQWLIELWASIQPPLIPIFSCLKLKNVNLSVTLYCNKPNRQVLVINLIVKIARLIENLKLFTDILLVDLINYIYQELTLSTRIEFILNELHFLLIYSAYEEIRKWDISSKFILNRNQISYNKLMNTQNIDELRNLASYLRTAYQRRETLLT